MIGVWGVGRALAALGIGLLADTVETNQLDVKVRKAPLDPLADPPLSLSIVPFPLGPGPSAKPRLLESQPPYPTDGSFHQTKSEQKTASEEVKNGDWEKNDRTTASRGSLPARLTEQKAMC